MLLSSITNNAYYRLRSAEDRQPIPAFFVTEEDPDNSSFVYEYQHRDTDNDKDRGRYGDRDIDREGSINNSNSRIVGSSSNSKYVAEIREQLQTNSNSRKSQEEADKRYHQYDDYEEVEEEVGAGAAIDKGEVEKEVEKEFLGASTSKIKPTTLQPPAPVVGSTVRGAAGGNVSATTNATTRAEKKHQETTATIKVRSCFTFLHYGYCWLAVNLVVRVITIAFFRLNGQEKCWPLT
jgi:hypothetical protein